jgi:hypothetical protein
MLPDEPAWSVLFFGSCHLRRTDPPPKDMCWLCKSPPEYFRQDTTRAAAAKKKKIFFKESDFDPKHNDSQSSKAL